MRYKTLTSKILEKYFGLVTIYKPLSIIVLIGTLEESCILIFRDYTTKN